MLCYLLLIISLTQMMLPGTECTGTSHGKFCNITSKRHMASAGVPGANINVALLRPNYRNILKKYTYVMYNIMRGSHEYCYEQRYAFSSSEYTHSGSDKTDMFKEKQAAFVRCSGPRRFRFLYTSIDRGFLEVEEKFLNDDCSYVPNLCVLLTTSPADNKSSVAAAAKSLLDSGVNIMVIAVGDDIDRDAVEDFASNEQCVFTTGKNMSERGDDIKRHAKDVAKKIKTALKQAHVLPKYTRCYEAGHFFIIIDVDKDHFETLTQLRDFAIDFDTDVLASVRTKMINSPTDDDRFQDHLSSVQRSAPGVTFEIFDSSYNISSSIKDGRKALMKLMKGRDSEKIIIVATNRKVDDIDDVIAESRASQRSGVHIMALGVGAEVLEDQLSQIITDPRGITKVETLEDFNFELRKLYQKMCSIRCYSGWVHYNGMCFTYISKSEKWLRARKVCGDLRAKLVSITTPRKYAWLKEEFLVKHKKPVHIGLRKYSLKSVPIGREFRWENGKPLLFSDWSVFMDDTARLHQSTSLLICRGNINAFLTNEKTGILQYEITLDRNKPFTRNGRDYLIVKFNFNVHTADEKAGDLGKTPPEPDGVSYEECVAWYPDGWRDVVCEVMINASFICEREEFGVTRDALKGFDLDIAVDMVEADVQSVDVQSSVPSVPALTKPSAPTKPSRFQQVDERGLQNIIEGSLSKATDKSTTWGVKLFRGVEVLPLWKENVCSAPDNGFDPWYGPVIVTGNECRPLLSVHWQPNETMNIFNCNNGELISQFLQCDDVSHCQDGSDEKLCSEDCTEYQFQCANGRCVSLAFFCDYWDDCSDNSDEETCVHPRCQSKHWQCDNGQCIPVNARCDLHYDCYDKSDEGESCSGSCSKPSNGTFKLFPSCNDGTCIPYHWLLDGHVDCGGGRFEDEDKVEVEKRPTKRPCFTGAYKDLFNLFNPKFDEGRPNCTIVSDGFGKLLGSVTNLTEDCRDDNVICPIGFFRCPSSFCIPIEKVCDGVMDCSDGQEEAGCDKFECPGYYRCPGASYCLHPSRICDGELDCPGGKDEVMCGIECHEGCNCSAGVVECKKIVKNITSPFDASTRKVVLKESRFLEPGIIFKRLYYLRQVVLSGVNLQRLTDVFDHHQMHLIDLNVSHNNLSEISPRVLSKLEKLTILDMSYNPLKRMSNESFTGLANLRKLYIRYTSIELLDKRLFSPLKRLEVLDVRGSLLHTIKDDAFFGLGQLRQLYMQGNTITKFGQRAFDGLDSLKELHTDMYSLCCPQVRPHSLAEADCVSPKSSISSCNDLLASGILRSSVWLLCIASVVGNVVSLVIRLIWERNSMQNGFGVFVTHLGIADFFMGAYLLIIAVADTLYKGKYIWNDYDWRHSSYCKIAGTLSTLSSEASTFFICLITLDRFLVIKFPFGSFKFRFTSASALAVLAWTVASVIAIVPLIPSLSHWNFYIKNGACLALPFATERHPGWIYSVAIFTGLNFVAFIVIAVGQYSIYRAMKKGSIVSSAGRRAQEMAIARKLVYIVVTDFFCWFPIGILSILALSGVSFGGEVYAWTAMFILPVNSALNPFLYTILAVIQKIKDRRQTKAGPKRCKVPEAHAHVRVRIGDPDPGQVLLEDVLRQLTAKEDRVKLMKDICEGLIGCSMTGTADQSRPNAVYLSIRGKVVDSICLTTRTGAPGIDLITAINSLVNIQPCDE